MRNIQFALVFFILIFTPGCDAPPEAKNLVRDKHAQLYVLASRIDGENKPSREQLEATVKALAKDMESLDKLLNNWKPSATMKELELADYTSPVDEIAVKLKKKGEER